MNLSPPKGILIVGVQGCGKSLAARVIARQWNLALLKLDAGRIYDSLVGQSEKNFRTATGLAEAMAPDVLWIDEIEKGFAATRGDADAGLSQRIFGAFLTWLQEKKREVFVVATANDLSKLPPELQRKGRFDEIFFVDLPDDDDRADIIRMYYQRFLGQQPPDALVKELVVLSAGFAGADIHAALHEVGVTAELPEGGLLALDEQFIKDNFTNTMPLSRTNPEQIEDIRTWGRERAVPAGTSSPPLPAAVSGSGRRRVVPMGG